MPLITDDNAVILALAFIFTVALRSIFAGRSGLDNARWPGIWP